MSYDPARSQMLLIAAEEESRACTEHLEREKSLTVELLRPFRLMKTRIFADGNEWCVLYGENLQDGVSGFGSSPEEASRNFDLAWHARMCGDAKKGGR